MKKQTPLHDIYDVAISFTSRDEEAALLAAELDERLRKRGLKVFYFRSTEEASEILGERLAEILPAVYRDRSRVVVMVGSENYGQTHWTKKELEAARERPRDDDGKPRIVPISADGTEIPGLPGDLIQVGEKSDAGPDLGEAVDLLARRCGRRGENTEKFLSVITAALSLLLIILPFLLKGISLNTITWNKILASAGILLITAFLAVPGLWMRKRIEKRRKKLMVVPEGPVLQRFRRITLLMGYAWIGLWLIMVSLTIWNVIDAGFAVKDIRFMITEGNLVAALNRMDANKVKLKDFRQDLQKELETKLAEKIREKQWRSFPEIYKSYARMFGRHKALEKSFWEQSGILRLQPGANSGDYLSAVEALYGVAPGLSHRLFNCVLARGLEHAMAGNDFFYGYDGIRAWSVYRRLEPTPGREQWIREHAAQALSGSDNNHLGLGARLVVFLMLHGDELACRRVVELVSLSHLEESTLEELGQISISGLECSNELERSLKKSWNGLLQKGDVTPDFVRLARVLNALNTGKADKLLLEAARPENQSPARRYVVSVLPFIIQRSSGEKRMKCLLYLDSALRELKVIAVYSFRMAMNELKPGDRKKLLEKELNSFRFLDAAKEGEDNVYRNVIKCYLESYLSSTGFQKDGSLVDEITRKWEIESELNSSGLPGKYEELVKYYESLGSPPGTSTDAGKHVEALRAFGPMGDRRAVKYLESRFDNLAHGNMRIAAAESLWLLTGNLKHLVLNELNSLTKMKSSIYRSEVVGMLSRNAERISRATAEERDSIIFILEQVINTGESRERGQALGLLEILEPVRAWKLAKGLAVCFNLEDRLEGFTCLHALWYLKREQLKF